MSDLAPKPEDLPTFAEGTTAADAPTFSPDALTVSDTAVTLAPAMVATAAALPATIGRYRIVRLIGEGGHGRGLRGRAGSAPPHGCPEGHQTGIGQPRA